MLKQHELHWILHIIQELTNAVVKYGFSGEIAIYQLINW